jgi:hypothetical protein
MKIYWISHSGEMAIWETSCAVSTEHFVGDKKAFLKRLKDVEKALKTGDVSSFTCGQIHISSQVEFY